MATTTLLAVLAVLVLLCSNARAESVVRSPPMKRALLAGPSRASERPSLSLNLPVWILESFSHPGWQQLWTTSRGGGVRSFFSCGMAWLTLRNSSWSLRAGPCPPGT